MRPHHSILLAALLTLPLAGCALVVGAGAAYIVTEEYLPDGFYETHVALDVDELWEAAQTGMGHLIIGSLVTEENPRRLTGEFRGQDVIVEVQAVDLDKSLLRVQAKQMIGYDEENARYVTDYILRQVD